MPVYDGEHVKYTYNSKNQVSAITTNTTEYTFTYDSYGNTKTIKAGDETLATYNYNPNNGKLQSLVYGNGTTVEYVYDELDRIEEIWYTEGSTETLKYRYTYTADGNLHTVEDLDSGEGNMYSYDSEGRSQLVQRTYHNVEDRWYLRLPEAWVDRIWISRSTSSGRCTPPCITSSLIISGPSPAPRGTAGHI